MGAIAQVLSVRLDGDYFRVSAPSLTFIKDKPLDRLKAGYLVPYVGQLTVTTGNERTLRARSSARFGISYDLWTERFTVTLATPTKPYPFIKNQTLEAAQAWCLDQLKVDLTQVPPDRPFWVRLEIRSEDPQPSNAVVGDLGISLNGLFEYFSRPAKPQQVRVEKEEGPFTLANLRRAHL
jgi:hypothetical protein